MYDLHVNIGIALLDFKLENSVFDNIRGLKLIDMESGVPLKERIKIAGGTVGYNAPERDGKHSYLAEKADMFSLGAAACVLMSETEAEFVTGIRDYARFVEIMNCKCQNSGEKFPDDFTALVFSLLSTDPLLRPTWD